MLKDFLKRKENGTLLIQKKAKLRELYQQTVELSHSQDGYVHFGDNVMLMNQGMCLILTNCRSDYGYVYLRQPTAL